MVSSTLLNRLYTVQSPRCTTTEDALTWRDWPKQEGIREKHVVERPQVRIQVDATTGWAEPTRYHQGVALGRR